MIGKPITGGSFKDTLLYCLEDKREISIKERLEASLDPQIQLKERAEVLDYHNCFGDLNDLTRQMVNVSKLNKKVEKPVFHFSIRPHQEDRLTREQFIEIGHKCAEEFGLTDNQYVIILHKDAKQHHIHIVANRVGFDGKVAKDTYSINRMQRFTRRMEEEYHLKQVLSARSILPKELRHIPRQNARLDKLKKDIQQTLEKVTTFPQFDERMKTLGYKVLKARGICFIDDKKVRIKGSEVGFPLAKIEKILAYKQRIAEKETMQNTKEKLFEIEQKREYQRPKIQHTSHLLKQLSKKNKREELSIGREEISMMKEVVTGVIHALFKTEYLDQSVSPDFLPEWLKKKKKQRQRQHL